MSPDYQKACFGKICHRLLEETFLCVELQNKKAFHPEPPVFNLHLLQSFFRPTSVLRKSVRLQPIYNSVSPEPSPKRTLIPSGTLGNRAFDVPHIRTEPKLNKAAPNTLYVIFHVGLAA